MVRTAAEDSTGQLREPRHKLIDAVCHFASSGFFFAEQPNSPAGTAATHSDPRETSMAALAKLSDLLCRAELRAEQRFRPRVAPRTVLHQFATVPTFLATDDKCHRLTILYDGDRFAILRPDKRPFMERRIFAQCV